MWWVEHKRLVFGSAGERVWMGWFDVEKHNYTANAFAAKRAYVYIQRVIVFTQIYTYN